MEKESKVDDTHASVFAKEFVRLFHLAFELQSQDFDKALQRSRKGRWVWGICLLLYIFFMFAGAYLIGSLFLIAAFISQIWTMTGPGGEMDKALGNMQGLLDAHDIVMEAKKAEVLDTLRQMEKKTGEEISVTSEPGRATIVRTPKKSKKLNVKEQVDEKNNS